MGEMTRNDEITFHFQDGKLESVRFRNHFGKRKIDSSHEVSPALFAELKAIAKRHTGVGWKYPLLAHKSESARELGAWLDDQGVEYAVQLHADLLNLATIAG